MIISVASGKGGTGKTTVSTNLALSIGQGVQLFDCDVEEPNVHLFLHPAIHKIEPVIAPVPEIDLEKCTFCKKCMDICRFGALAVLKKNVLVFENLCHSCGGCFEICPENAVLEKEINAPFTSSAGRLFDAVAAMTGICTKSAFHAEAPMRLESVMDENESGHYDFQIGDTINPGLVIRSIIDDIRKNVPAGSISAKFHRAIVEVIKSLSMKYHDETGINKVVLSGGTFQNRFLLAETIKKLEEMNLQVYTHKHYPTNDGGIALGQLVIAAKHREFKNMNKFSYEYNS